jgi:hypothetical protein
MKMGLFYDILGPDKTPDIGYPEEITVPPVDKIYEKVQETYEPAKKLQPPEAGWLEKIQKAYERIKFDK